MIRKALLAGGAFALAAGAAVAGTAAASTSGTASAGSATPAASTVDDAALASAVTAADGDAGTPADTAGTPRPRRQALCARVPTAIVRTQNLEKRLAADASTQGSLAYLQARIDKAEAAHQDQLVTVLKNRMAFRQELAAFLPQRLALLQKASTTVCAPLSTTSPSS